MSGQRLPSKGKAARRAYLPSLLRDLHTRTRPPPCLPRGPRALT